MKCTCFNKTASQTSLNYKRKRACWSTSNVLTWSCWRCYEYCDAEHDMWMLNFGLPLPQSTLRPTARQWVAHLFVKVPGNSEGTFLIFEWGTQYTDWDWAHIEPRNVSGPTLRSPWVFTTAPSICFPNPRSYFRFFRRSCHIIRQGASMHKHNETV